MATRGQERFSGISDKTRLLRLPTAKEFSEETAGRPISILGSGPFSLEQIKFIGFWGGGIIAATVVTSVALLSAPMPQKKRSGPDNDPLGLEELGFKRPEDELVGDILEGDEILASIDLVPTVPRTLGLQPSGRPRPNGRQVVEWLIQQSNDVISAEIFHNPNTPNHEALVSLGGSPGAGWIQVSPNQLINAWRQLWDLPEPISLATITRSKLNGWISDVNQIDGTFSYNDATKIASASLDGVSPAGSFTLSEEDLRAIWAGVAALPNPIDITKIGSTLDVPWNVWSQEVEARDLVVCYNPQTGIARAEPPGGSCPAGFEEITLDELADLVDAANAPPDQGDSSEESGTGESGGSGAGGSGAGGSGAGAGGSGSASRRIARRRSFSRSSHFFSLRKKIRG